MSIYGDKVPRHPDRRVGVIAEPEVTGNGNIALRVGHVEKGSSGWLQTEYVLLTKEEGQKLADLLDGRRQGTAKQLWRWLDNMAANIRHYQLHDYPADEIRFIRTRMSDTMDVLALLTGEPLESIKEQHDERQVTLANG